MLHFILEAAANCPIPLSARICIFLAALIVAGLISYALCHTIYWRNYALVGILVVVGFSVGVSAVFDVVTLLDPNTGDAGQELFRIFTSIVAFVVAMQVSDIAIKSRARAPSVELERVEDATAKAWKKVNHSFYKLGWSPELSSEQVELLERLEPSSALCKFFTRRAGVVIFERLLEDTGTLNFRRLHLFCPAKFIRIHRNIDMPLQRLRHSIRLHLSNTLPRGSLAKGKLMYLVPIRAPHNERYDVGDTLKSEMDEMGLQLISQTEALVPDGFAEITWCYDNDTRFSGTDENELRSVAHVIAEIQRALASWSPNSSVHGINTTALADHVGKVTDRYRRRPDKLSSRWANVKKRLVKSTSGTIGDAATELNSYIDEYKVDEIVAEVVALRNQHADCTNYLLHDIHPHNVFCEEKICSLIYDYTYVGKWPPEMVIAFSLHRFVREMIIRRCIDSNPKANECRELATVFLNAYDERLPNEMKIKDRILPKLGLWIRDANIDKLVSAAEYTLETRADNFMRSSDRQRGELRKFLRYMQESRKFDPIA